MMSNDTPTPARRLTDGGWPDAEATAERIYRAYRSEVAVAISPAAWANLQDADRKFYRMVARIALADVSAAHARTVAQAREEALRSVKDDLEEQLATEQTDWHDECQAYGVDPDCYGAGFHAGMAAGLQRALDTLTPTPSPEDRT